MNVAFINPFITACREVFDTMVHVPISLSKPQLKDPEARTFKVAGVLTLSGAVEGIVAIGFSERVALVLAGGLTGSTCEALDADVMDALAEITNMVVGSAKKNLPGGLTTISVPKVMQAQDAVPYPQGLPIILIPFDTPAGRFVIEVSLRMTAQAAMAQAPGPAATDSAKAA